MADGATTRCDERVDAPPTAQFLLTLAEDNALLERRAAGHTALCRLLFSLTAAVPGSDTGDALFLRVVGAGTTERGGGLAELSQARPEGPAPRSAARSQARRGAPQAS